jgi:hypothetical protein
MSNIILLHQRDKAVQRVNDNNPNVYEDKSEAKAATESLAGNNLRMAILIAVLARPRPLVYSLKKDQMKRLAKSLSRKAGIGILIATRQKDEPKIAMYKSYKRTASHTNAWDIYQAAVAVADELAKAPELIANAGISALELAAFKTQAIEFGLTIEATDAEIKQRKSAVEERNSLMSANAAILKYQLDPFTNHVQDLFPDFFRDYKIARRSPLPRKATAKPEEILSEISGTVTDTATSEPVIGATVLVTELNLVVTTDEDGYYLFDEVPVGAFTISCHAAGYKLPTNVPVTISDTQPLQLDFGLEPEVGEQAA